MPLKTNDRVNLSAKNCNVLLQDQNAKFDPVEISGEYILNLENPYERAIAIKLITIVANDSLLTFNSILYQDTSIKSSKLLPVELTSGTVIFPFERMSQRHKKMVQRYEKFKKNNWKASCSREIFNKYDSDQDGSLNHDEVAALLEFFEFDLKIVTVKSMMSKFDADNSGTIDYFEFMVILKSLVDDAKGRYIDLTETRIMCLKSVQDEAFLPPQKGILKMILSRDYDKQVSKKVLSPIEV